MRALEAELGGDPGSSSIEEVPRLPSAEIVKTFRTRDRSCGLTPLQSGAMVTLIRQAAGQ